jgi:hypothetical protein
MKKTLLISMLSLAALCGCATRSPQPVPRPLTSPESASPVAPGTTMSVSAQPELKDISGQERQLTQEKTAIRSELPELLKKYKEAHPTVVQKRARLQTIEKELKQLRTPSK